MAKQPDALTVGTSDDEFDNLIEEASLPWKLVPLCLNGTLRREYEDVKARIAERAAERDAARTVAAAEALNTADIRLGTKTPEAPPEDDRDPEQDRLEELVEAMRAELVKFVVQAMPSPEYNKLVEAHPPRKDPATGRVDQRDYQGFNATTFYPALVRESITRPTMTDARWAKLTAVLTDTQFDRLATTAAELNRREEDLPF